MRLAKDFLSALKPIDMSFAGADASGEPALVSDGGEALWQRQQERLASHRQRFAMLAEKQRAGANRADEIAQVYRMIVGRQHVIGEWRDLWAVAVALSQLDPKYHRGIITLGGWYSTGGQLPSGLRPAPADLLARLEEFRFFAVAEELRYELRQRIAISGSQDQPDARKKLLDHLKGRNLCNTDGSNDLDRFEEHLETKMVGLLATIEDQLLFLDRRTFFFTPGRVDLTAGWRDFWRFATAYSWVAPRLNFKNYEWSIRLPKR